MNFLANLLKSKVTFPISKYENDKENDKKDNEVVKIAIKIDKQFKDDSSFDDSKKIRNQYDINDDDNLGSKEIVKVDGAFHRRKRFLSDDLSPQQILHLDTNSIPYNPTTTINSLKDDSVHMKNQSISTNSSRKLHFYIFLFIIFVAIIGILAFIFKCKQLLLS